MRVLLIAEEQSDTRELEAAIRAAGHQLVEKRGLQSGYAHGLTGLAIEMVIFSLSAVKREMLKELHQLPVPLVIFAEVQCNLDTTVVLDSGVSAYVVDGFRGGRVGAVIDLAQARFKQVEGLKLQLSNSRQALEERREIDRAKGIIMKQKGCSEEQAYQALRKTAMDQNKRMGEIAKSVITLESFMS